MSLSLIGLAYALFSAAIGFGVLFVAARDVVDVATLRRFGIAWVIVAVGLFVIPNGGLFLVFGVAFFTALTLSARGEPLEWAALLVCAAPAAGVAIFNLPFGINYLLDFSFAMFLSIGLLVPIVMRRLGGARLSGAGAIDALMILFFVLVVLLDARDATLTTAMRNATKWFLLGVAPYLAFSRGLTSVTRLRGVQAAFLAAMIVLSVICIFGAVTGWRPYDVPERQLFDSWGYSYLYRGGLLRNGATMASSPITLGCMLLIGAAFLFAFADKIRHRWQFLALLGVLGLGFLGSFSRGPIVGVVVGVIAFQLTRPNPLPALIRTGAVGAVLLVPVLLFTEPGRTIIATLPFIGTDEASAGSVDYRAELFRQGLKQIGRFPLFGTTTYREQPEMVSMIQGEGIVDIVNSYLRWALQYGLVTTTAYVAALVLAALQLFAVIRRLDPARPDQAAARYALGGVFAALVGLGFTLATMSQTNLVPYLTYMMMGVNVGALRVGKAALRAPVPAATTDAPAVVAAETEAQTSDPADAEPEPLAPPAPRPASSFGLQTPLDFDLGPLTPKPQDR